MKHCTVCKGTDVKIHPARDGYLICNECGHSFTPDDLDVLNLQELMEMLLQHGSSLPLKYKPVMFWIPTDQGTYVSKIIREYNPGGGSGDTFDIHLDNPEKI